MLDLIRADYTFVNERLAEHYGIDGVFGDAFRRVTLHDPNRRGLLGQGSILFQTSVANRTSPVFRGKWIMTNIFNSPPPPPPPNVPSLDESTSEQHSAQRARAPRAASEGARLRRVSRDHRSSGARSREFRSDRSLARDGFGPAGRRDDDATGRHCGFGPEWFARSDLEPSRALRFDFDGEAHGVRAGAPPRSRGHADRAPHRSRSRARRLSGSAPSCSASCAARSFSKRRASRRALAQTVADNARSLPRQESRSNVHHEETSFAPHRAARRGRCRDRLAAARRDGARRQRRAAGSASVRRGLRAERRAAGDLDAAIRGQARAAAAARAVRAVTRAHQHRDGNPGSRIRSDTM